MEHHYEGDSEITYRTFVVPTLLVSIIAFAFLFSVWPTTWRYDHVENTTARTNRFTGEVQTLSLTGWHSVSASTPPTRRITAEDLKHVELDLGERGLASLLVAMTGATAIQGTAYNSLSTPLSQLPPAKAGGLSLTRSVCL